MKLTRSSYQHNILLICNLWIVPAKDVFHDAVRHALEKEQWIITDDPLFLRFGGVDMYIDRLSWVYGGNVAIAEFSPSLNFNIW